MSVAVVALRWNPKTEIPRSPGLGTATSAGRRGPGIAEEPLPGGLWGCQRCGYAGPRQVHRPCSTRDP